MTTAVAYFETREKALKEVRKRRSESSDENMLIRFEQTTYGNWKVYSFPADFLVDMNADGPSPSLMLPSLRLHKPEWPKS